MVAAAFDAFGRWQVRRLRLTSAKMRAVLTDVPESDDFLLVAGPSAAALNDPPNSSERFERLMNFCCRDSGLMRATAWQLVTLPAVVAVSLVEASLLCATFKGLQPQASDGADVKAARLPMQPATHPGQAPACLRRT